MRSRLTALFAVGTGLIVAVTSIGIYFVLAQRADAAINDALDARAGTITGTLDNGEPAVGDDDPFAVVFDSSGKVVAASPSIVNPADVLSPSERASATAGRVIVNRAVAGLSNDARLLAKADDVNGQTYVVVTGVDLRAVHTSTARLITILVIVTPLLALVLAGGAWLVIGAALGPVHRLTAEAEEISRIDVGRRLVVSGADDEIGELGRTLNAMLDRLEVAFARERAFVDDASHELRTPLAVLRGELELALSGPPEPDLLRPAIASALDETRRLTQLAEDLLVLARAGAGQVPSRTASVNVNTAAHAALERLVNAELPVLVEITGTAMAATDPARLHQILTNVTTNAQRHARSRVEMAITTKQGWVEVTIADDGAGFPEDFIAHAFDRFSQANPARTRNGRGSGLGLAIVAALTATLGGTVTVGNGGLLGGAWVHLRLPAATPAD